MTDLQEVEECPICGSEGPCGFDADGRPMVHTDLGVTR